MIKLNIHEAKTHLSRYLDKLERGEDPFCCANGIFPLPRFVHCLSDGKRSGQSVQRKGQFTVPAEFFEPLPPDIIDAFNGKEP